MDGFGFGVTALAVVWFFVWPEDRVTEQEGLRYLMLRRGHMLVWALVALIFWPPATGKAPHKFVDVVAAAGGVVYLAFLAFTYVIT